MVQNHSYVSLSPGWVFCPLGIYLLIRYLPAIDPKRTARLSRQTFQKVGIAVVTLIAAINIIILYSAAARPCSPDVNHLVVPTGWVCSSAYLGNLMYSIKPNYFVGIRTPLDPRE